MKKKIKVIPRKSETLCKRCIHANIPHKIPACIFIFNGSPCLFFKKKIPSLQEKPDIDAMPAADVVEVVRCKECKQGYIRLPNSKIKICWCGKWNNIMPQDGYCSFGERRIEREVNNNENENKT